MSRIVDGIENFLFKLGITFENQYSMTSVGYMCLYLWQTMLYLFDSFCAVTGDRKVERFDNIGFFVSFILFAIIYGLLFVLIEPENKRWFSFCGILGAIRLVTSTIFYFYIYLRLKVEDNRQFLYWTNRMAPISMLFMSGLLMISVLIMCKMSFFRSSKKVLEDLYEVEETGGKKAV
ncbi:DUF1084 domain-containing protein [Caenorhabditis elegans]|uniref:DUF1084 domain-containing protein n=1 Tax=Caenorhabditis elegans TaxID=6239 RepID=A9QY36_CAEEL|nr:DUF1084 domain-containing protein [Caenorhabditis elegans]CAP46779.2 DUF1084 domain-containing protein [Caenorhabditis elegans]|eukprot:NP_001122970.2 Uncharacterized protein CELE_K06B4.15 [Caenorhabditis elegans]